MLTFESTKCDVHNEKQPNYDDIVASGATKNEQIFLPILEEKKVTSFVKREDEIHPFVSGNKFRKLKPRKTCTECLAEQPARYNKEANIAINAALQHPQNNFPIAEYPAQGKKILMSAEIVFEIFSNITDEDVEIMGFNVQYSRPENLICSLFPVPPPCVRPSNLTETSQRSVDDLTYKILDINQKAYLLNLMNIIFNINFSKYNKFPNQILF